MAAYGGLFGRKAADASNDAGAKSGGPAPPKPPSAMSALNNANGGDGGKAKSIECEPPPCWNPCDTKCKIRYQQRPFHPADPCEGDDSLSYSFKMLGFAVAAMAFIYSVYAVRIKNPFCLCSGS